MRQRMTQAERFARGLHRECSAKQLEVIREKMIEGWKPFTYKGYRGAVHVYCSKPSGVRSNVVPGADHLRIEPNGLCVRYDPKRK